MCTFALFLRSFASIQQVLLEVDETSPRTNDVESGVAAQAHLDEEDQRTFANSTATLERFLNSGKGRWLVIETISSALKIIFDPWGNSESFSEPSPLLPGIKEKLMGELRSRLQTDPAISLLEVGAKDEFDLKPPSFAHKGLVAIPAATTQLKAIASGYTANFAKSLTKRVARMVVSEVHDTTSEHLATRAAETVAHFLVHTIPPLVFEASGPAIADSSQAYLTVNVINAITPRLIKTLTRSITQSLSATLVASLSRSPENLTFCYYCYNHDMYCERCRAGFREEHKQRAGLHYVHYYAQHYSDYFGDFFSQPPKAASKKK
mmetsp:Transcript_28544/g.55548  ORF Transcript_28544/g.55548 Transcript_28544/m.55548 type:complete len:321 (-) Transcript_28544:92-1054(-)